MSKDPDNSKAEQGDSACQSVQSIGEIHRIGKPCHDKSCQQDKRCDVQTKLQVLKEREIQRVRRRKLMAIVKGPVREDRAQPHLKQQLLQAG